MIKDILCAFTGVLAGVVAICACISFYKGDIDTAYFQILVAIFSAVTAGGYK